MPSVENFSCRQLSCQRGGRYVFRNLGFTLGVGGFLQVTGDNGSGKSTLLRVLAGLLPPASGTASEMKAHYIGHMDAVKPSLTVREMLGYWAALRGVAVEDSACAAFGIQDLLDKPVRALSAGQKKRLSLTRLMLGNAHLWLLDEPTTSLDAAGRVLLFAAIARHRKSGGMVVAATHESWSLADANYLKMGAE